VDKFSKEVRSAIMSKIRYKWTKPERKVHGYLKGHHITHKMHPKKVPGADIFVFKTNTAVLLHGCFWHGCKICYKKPKSNRKFWKNKLQANLKRDSRTKKALKKLGYKILVIWEHELRKNFQRALRKITGV